MLSDLVLGFQRVPAVSFSLRYYLELCCLIIHTLCWGFQAVNSQALARLAGPSDRPPPPSTSSRSVQPVCYTPPLSEKHRPKAVPLLLLSLTHSRSLARLAAPAAVASAVPWWRVLLGAAAGRASVASSTTARAAGARPVVVGGAARRGAGGAATTLLQHHIIIIITRQASGWVSASVYIEWQVD